MGDVVPLGESFPSVHKGLSSVPALCKPGMMVYTYDSNWRSYVHSWLCSELKGSHVYAMNFLEFTYSDSRLCNQTTSR